MVYLPTFTIIYHNNQPNVGKYTIHRWYGLDELIGRNCKRVKLEWIVTVNVQQGIFFFPHSFGIISFSLEDKYLPGNMFEDDFPFPKVGYVIVP